MDPTKCSLEYVFQTCNKDHNLDSQGFLFVRFPVQDGIFKVKKSPFFPQCSKRLRAYMMWSREFTPLMAEDAWPGVDSSSAQWTKEPGQQKRLKWKLKMPESAGGGRDRVGDGERNPKCYRRSEKQGKLGPRCPVKPKGTGNLQKSPGSGGQQRGQRGSSSPPLEQNRNI